MSELKVGNNVGSTQYFVEIKATRLQEAAYRNQVRMISFELITLTINQNGFTLERRQLRHESLCG